MPLLTGQRIGAYEVVSQLGAGGMGEVYRARDSKLKREVALKVLPADVAGDLERLARFQREAEVLASLNHPHIAHVYGIEGNALVMELVDGEDLSERIRGGPIPIDEALPIAKQIAEALEAAHDRGIVHRDLKPGNIKVRPDGTVKVLDFGLAKAMEPGTGSRQPGAGTALADSPTITSPAMTMSGVILGTAAYMAPEQAKGHPVDRRADIWAFGVVLFEMLTGRRAFTGGNTSEVIAAVLRDVPSHDHLPAATPAAIRRLLRRCLTKDPKQRIADASTVRLEIQDAMAGDDSEPAAATRASARWPWAAAAVMAIVAAGAIGYPLLSPPPAARIAPPEVRFTIDGTLSNGALSPDGTHIAYRARAGAEIRLVVRSLASGATKALEAAGEPGLGSLAGSHFWSPDSTSIAFFAGQKLRRIDVATGTIQTLADAPTPRGGAWSPDGTIVFAPGSSSPLYRVAAAGGNAEAVTTLREGESSHRDPQFLADGRRFIYWVLGPVAVRGVYLGSIDGSRGIRLLDADGPASFAAPDQVLFVREGVLYGQRLDLAASTMIGEPMMVASGIAASPTTGRSISASGTGVIAYRPEVEDRRQVAWVDRAGKPLERIGEPRAGVTAGSLSPDGETIALGVTTFGRNDVWLMDRTRGTAMRFAADANQPTWAPDGTRVVFTSGRDGLIQMYERKVDGSDEPRRVFPSSEAQNIGDWSPDGHHILFSSQSPTLARDIWALARNTGTATRFISSPAEEGTGRFSPEGKWVAYTSDETGAGEIYVRSFPGPGRAWRVSTSGGAFPFWRRDGGELYWTSPAGIMAASIHVAADTIKVGAPERLFPLAGNAIASPDGKRFLIAASVGDVQSPPLTVVVNWAGHTR